MKPSDQVQRKFEHVAPTSEWEVLSHDGWRDVYSSNKTIPYELHEVVLENGLTLTCADTHILMTDQMEEVFAKDSVGCTINTIEGPSKVVSVEPKGSYENMYDLSVSGDNLYYTDGILSHNTTASVAIILHAMLFSEYEYIALTANKERTARRILKRIQTSYKQLPFWMQQGVEEWNKGSVSLENGSEVIAAATSSDAIRGDSVTFLYIDEIAYVDNWDEFSASVLPTVSSGESTRVFYTSTPCGLNHFWHIIENGRKGRNGFNVIEAPWWRVPGRDEKWRQQALAALDYDEQRFAQEYSCVFQGSSGTLIRGDTLQNLVFEDPLESKAGFRVYENPAKDHTYVIVCDVSRGKGLDYSAFSIIDITEMPYKQVACYRNNMITPTDYAEVIYRSAKMYSDAYVLVEVNDIGGQVSESIFSDYEYENVLGTRSHGRAGIRLEPAGGGAKGDYGVRTTKTVKNRGCSMLKMLVEQQQLLITDVDAIHELSVFSQRRNTYAAEPGQTDDIVMGLVLFGWMTNDPLFKELTEINTMAELRESPHDRDEDLVPFGIIQDGREDDYQYEPDAFGDGQWWQKVDVGQEEFYERDPSDDLSPFFH